MKSNTSTRAARRKPVIIITVTLTVLALIVIFLWSPVSPFKNYAEEVAKPLEQALIASGGVKVSGSGSNGRVPGNSEPYYNAYVTIPKNREQTEGLIKKVAEQNQYRLTPASPGNRGHVGVADIYIHHWYFDNTSKDNPYRNLEPGKIELAFALYNDRESAPLTTDEKGKTQLIVDESHTFVRLQIRLPNFKSK